MTNSQSQPGYAAVEQHPPTPSPLAGHTPGPWFSVVADEVLAELDGRAIVVIAQVKLLKALKALLPFAVSLAIDKNAGIFKDAHAAIQKAGG